MKEQGIDEEQAFKLMNRLDVDGIYLILFIIFIIFLY